MAVKRLVEHVENRTYFDDIMALTGPSLLREVANGTGMVTRYNERCWVKYWTPMKPILDMYTLFDGNSIYNEE